MDDSLVPVSVFLAPGKGCQAARGRFRNACCATGRGKINSLIRKKCRAPYGPRKLLFLNIPTRADAAFAPERQAFFALAATSILAKVGGRCYLQIMELLEQLESHVTALLAKLDRLKAENTRLRAESSAIVAEKAVLEEENHKLHESFAKEEALRTEALKRIDALLRRIQEHDSIE